MMSAIWFWLAKEVAHILLIVLFSVVFVLLVKAGERR